MAKKTPDKMRVVVYNYGIVPTRAYPTDAGMDLYTPIDVAVPPSGEVVVDTLVACEIPEGYFGLITSKSGLMAKGITSRGTVDSSYRGHIRAVLFNHSNSTYYFKAGEKVTQMIICPCITPELDVVTELSKTERSDNGFGSTGK